MEDPCDKINQNLRDICRCKKAGLTLSQCNRRRVAWGIPPLSDMPDEQPEPLKPMSVVSRARSFASVTAQTVWRFVAHGEGMLSKAEMQPRLDACNACEHLKNGHCTICGCSCQTENKIAFLGKLAHRSASCPLPDPKWGPSR